MYVPLIVLCIICAFLLFFYQDEKKRRLTIELSHATLLERASRIPELEAQLKERFNDFELLKERYAVTCALLQEEKKKTQEKIELLHQTQEQLKGYFKSISHDALRDQQRVFFELAKQTFESYKNGISSDAKEKQQAIEQLVKPLHDSLSKVDTSLQALEKARLVAYAGVAEQLKHLASSHTQLQTETANLVKALRMPHVRGRWGELQLKRVVEMAGMLEHCDFTSQQTFSDQEARLRPDLVIKLPNARSIIVDSKAPLAAYLEAIEAPDDQKKMEYMGDHARQIRRHIGQLAEKGYWESVSQTPEFVVMFLPGEAFFSAALEQDPSLIEYGVDKKVIIATPTTLIALLRSVAYGWQEKAIAEHAEYISDLAKSLYERLSTLIAHFKKLKRSLDATNEAYNEVIGSFEGRVLVAARRFKELKVVEGKPDLELLQPVEKTTRDILVATDPCS